MLTPPAGDGPAVVRATFELRDIHEINDEAEAFEFTGLLVLSWKDPRQAFDPAVAGVREKIYQGDFQFDEVSPGWYPQIVLANESGLYETQAVLSRIQPDGTCILAQTFNAIAEADLNMRRFPFDSQRLEAAFEVFGFDSGEVVLEAGAVAADREIRISQWRLDGVEAEVLERDAPYFGAGAKASRYLVSIGVRRESMFMLRMVAAPLALIVILSWSIFWMDRSSLGDRINISFVGILTAVAYQIVISDLLPHVSYITLMHGFLNLSLLTMCAGVLVSLAVGACDRSGRPERGDRIDRRCRRIFPLVYGGLLLVMALVVFLWF